MQDPLVVVAALLVVEEAFAVVVAAFDVELVDPDEERVSRCCVTRVDALTCDSRADAASGELGKGVENPGEAAGHGDGEVSARVRRVGCAAHDFDEGLAGCESGLAGC